MTQPAQPSPPFILPLTSPQADLPSAGGKGANLSRLARAGFPVPPGFLVTTRAYQAFVAANRLDEQIQALLPVSGQDDLQALEQASNRIRALFAAGTIPAGLAGNLVAAYQALGAVPVAVRSSATAEDLPGMSFAGQHDTYLNVVGTERLLQSVVACWSSLWTARAIGYRARNQLPHSGVALAVVVQELVASQAAGVLFTANPLSGLRAETVIEATLGLGEALVSGQVQADRYLVDPAGEKILSKTLGTKALSLHGQPAGGLQVTEQVRSEVQALPDEQILALARLGSQVEALYGFPQDVEWAWDGVSLYLLQSRPITSLFPLPEGMPAEPLKVMFSFAAVQGLLDPLTPLGRDALRQLFAAGAGLFGVRVTRETQTALYVAGERLWVNFTPVLQNSVGRRVVPAVLELVEPTVRQAVVQIWDDPRLQPKRPGISWSARARLARFFLPLAANLWLNILAPRRRRLHIVEQGERLLERVQARSASVAGDRWEKLAQQAELLPDLAARSLPHTLVLFISGVAAGMASWNLLNLLAGRTARGLDLQDQASRRDLVLQVTRGMPYNPTTEMDLALWQLAKTLRRDPPSWEVFKCSRPAELAARLRSGDLPEVARQGLDRFLNRYGGRGLGEVDLGRSRWAEDSTHVFEMLASFLHIEEAAQAPDQVFARGAVSAQEAVDQLAAAVRQERAGWLKARLVRFLAGRARQLMGLRENPKFFAVRMLWIIRRALLASGEEFVRAGDLDCPDDLFYLTLSELHAFAARQQQDWRGLVARRREACRREQLRKQIPRLLLSDGRAFYEGLSPASGDAGNALSGSPVSPGSVQGRVRVVLDPSQAGLLPGEILVCPGTDPSWTPLFLSAGGLVMETGGLMTHGAVVAREYGLPAIVGVDRATQRLHTGQLISMDGSSGQILILEEQEVG